MTKTSKLDLFLEQLLSEAEPVDRPESMADFAPTDDEPVSLDQAVDRYFVQYERESIPTSEVFESNVSNLVNYLFEQEAEEPEEDPEADAGGDLDLGGGEAGGDLDLGGLGADPAGGAADGDLGGDIGGLGGDEAGGAEGGEEDAEQQPVVNTPQINLQDFTRSVARLVNNATSLIDFRTLILNRAEAYIKNNYNERTAKEMMDILDKQWDLRPETLENTANQTPEHPQPHTAVTGPLGG